MTPLDLIGAVAAARLKRDLEAQTGDGAENGGSIARYVLHKLSGAEVAAICRAVDSRPDLAPSVTLRIPRDLVEGHHVPAGAVFDGNAARARNAPCDTPILVIVDAVGNSGDTLGQVTLLGTPELKADAALWVTAARSHLPLPKEHDAVWASAIEGLKGAEDIGLSALAEYVNLTRHHIGQNGQPLLEALGWALPALRLPRQSGIFLGLKEKDQTAPAKWRRLYQQTIAQRRGLLHKQGGARDTLDRETLQTQYSAVRQRIQPAAYLAVEAFISAAPGWNNAARGLAECEWERDGTQHLFENLKPRPADLGTQTIDFFAYELPDRLTDGEREYLDGLKKRQTYTDPRDEDIEFYETYRTELGSRRPLKAKWDKFIYGTGVEHQDFVVGLLLAIEKVFEQAEHLQAPRTLTIRTQKRTPKDWFDVNAELLSYFALRYRERDRGERGLNWFG